MSDQSLRDALEKLADDYEYIPSFRVAELLAAHPVEPAPVCVCLEDETGTEISALCTIHNPKPAEPAGVSDEAVEAAEQAMRGHDCHEIVNRNIPHLARVALEAAQPFMQPQVVASREAVRERLWRSLAGTGVTGIFRDELAEAQTDALLAAGVFREPPTRERVEQVVREICLFRDVISGTDAVLNLLGGAAE